MTTQPDPASAHPNGAELRRKTYSELASRAGRMLASTFPLLVILAIVLGQHIRESSSKENRTNDEIGRALVRMQEAQNKMKAQKRELFASLRGSDRGQRIYVLDLRRTEKEGEAIAAVPPPPVLTGSRLDPAGAPAGSGASAGQLTLGLHQFPTEREELDVLDRSDFVAQMSARIESVRAKLIEVSAQKGTRGKEDEEEISQLSTVVSAGESYLAEYQTYAHFREEAARLESSLDELKTKKEAVPTPFGSFAIDPRFALLGLTLGALYAFAYFLLLLGRVRTAADTFARDYGQPVTEDGAVAFWTSGPAGARRLAASGLASCALWALLCSWLLYESLGWRAVDSVYFTPRSAWNYVLLGATLSALGIGVASLVSERRLERIKNVDLGRRSLIRIGLCALGGLALGGGFLLLRRFRGEARGAKPDGTALLLPAGVPLQDLVANRKTGILHHKTVCEDHLPAAGHREPVAPADLARLQLHGKRRQQILQAFAATALENKHPDDAIRFLEVAIALSPASVHLYDRIADIHGRSKEYPRIEELFKGGFKHAEQALQKEQSSPQPREKVVNRLKDQVAVFRNRVETSERRQQKL